MSSLIGIYATIIAVWPSWDHSSKVLYFWLPQRLKSSFRGIIASEEQAIGPVSSWPFSIPSWNRLTRRMVIRWDSLLTFCWDIAFWGWLRVGCKVRGRCGAQINSFPTVICRLVNPLRVTLIFKGATKWLKLLNFSIESSKWLSRGL